MNRQQQRFAERQRLKNMERENKNFKDKFKRIKLELSATKAFFETENIGLKREVERLRNENKELSKGYQKQAENERERQFTNRIIKHIPKIASDFTIQCPECLNYIDLYNEDNFKDEFLDDTNISEFECPHCQLNLEITTNSIHSFTAELVYDDE